MLTANQIDELETLLREKKSQNQSIRIADVTRVIYPVSIKSFDNVKKPHK